MTDMWIDLLPVLFAMLISPARTLAVILLLHTPRTTATALGYVAGMVSAMMVQGAALGAGMRLIGLTDDDRSADLEVFVGALFVGQWAAEASMVMMSAPSATLAKPIPRPRVIRRLW